MATTVHIDCTMPHLIDLKHTCVVRADPSAISIVISEDYMMEK